MYSGGNTGLAILLRDGFVSLDGSRAITTKHITFDGKYLFLHTEAKDLRADILDESGWPIAPFTAANCAPVNEDSTSAQIKWQGESDLSKLRGRPIRFRFTQRSGALYCFSVSPKSSGTSRGHVAAGGPSVNSATDT